MKRIVSVSIGSSQRDSSVEVEILNEIFNIERIGTDGSLKKAVKLIKQLDGKVDALGMGGIDLYLWDGKKRYTIREAMALKRAAQITPIVDGSGLKNTLERRVIAYLGDKDMINFKEKITLITSALDRFGMAEAIEAYGGRLIIGDIAFALGLNIPMYSLKQIQYIARVVAPVLCQLPIKMLYPTGGKQNTNIKGRVERYYQDAHIIAGDFHYIKRYMPLIMEGKIIITNTVTKQDILELKKRGVVLLITTTPRLGDRSFGTNLMEAIMVSFIKQGKYSSYDEVIDAMDLKPRMEYLTTQPNMD
ncbi:quinate 5-dehydrogenase [Natronincola ferrireducens]|uniref:Quinate 5-dehydrogenase n=1 Tax=Natronincola ferrireducens TaxID=393762 RepID=A0A1G9FID6_9FIRM|nr:quinate 5-dehydrogenase [Natronincola ferrireducens]SDK88102.1 hypothetical protein SAMN05660472_02203 [Natronincola ferrireducens]